MLLPQRHFISALSCLFYGFWLSYLQLFFTYKNHLHIKLCTQGTTGRKNFSSFSFERKYTFEFLLTFRPCSPDSTLTFALTQDRFSHRCSITLMFWWLSTTRFIFFLCISPSICTFHTISEKVPQSPMLLSKFPPLQKHMLFSPLQLTDFFYSPKHKKQMWLLFIIISP